jgi:hypothetical protein
MGMTPCSGGGGGDPCLTAVTAQGWGAGKQALTACNSGLLTQDMMRDSGERKAAGDLLKWTPFHLTCGSDGWLLGTEVTQAAGRG